MTRAAEQRLNRNLREFNRDVNRYAKTILPADMNRFVRWLALEVLRRVVLRTPVKTGRLRGNWQIGINASPDGIVDKNDPGGSQTIQSGTGKIMSVKFAQQIFITNNLPYAIAIEDGHSKIKAPAGMVAVTLAELRSIFP